jgi:hypothetical protein
MRPEPPDLLADTVPIEALAGAVLDAETSYNVRWLAKMFEQVHKE